MIDNLDFSSIGRLALTVLVALVATHLPNILGIIPPVMKDVAWIVVFFVGITSLAINLKKLFSKKKKGDG